MDIIVTTQKSKIAVNSRRAREAKNGLIEFYERRIQRFPSKMNKGDKIFYIEEGIIVGYLIVDDILDERKEISLLGNNRYKGICYLKMRCDSWKWITTLPHNNFTEYRYTSLKENINYNIIGEWNDPRPDKNYIYEK